MTTAFKRLISHDFLQEFENCEIETIFYIIKTPSFHFADSKVSFFHRKRRIVEIIFYTPLKGHKYLWCFMPVIVTRYCLLTRIAAHESMKVALSVRLECKPSEFRARATHEKTPDITGTVLIKVNFPSGILDVAIVVVDEGSLSRATRRERFLLGGFIHSNPRPSTALHLSLEPCSLHQYPSSIPSSIDSPLFIRAFSFSFRLKSVRCFAHIRACVFLPLVFFDAVNVYTSLSYVGLRK